MDPNSSRRNFLAAGLALPVAASASRFSASQANTPSKAPASAPKLQYGTLGKTGMKVTRVGFGCMTTSDASVIARALDLGINLFDTARSYQSGNNERMVGAVLKDRRNEIFINSKSNSQTKEQALGHLDTSLKELGTDHLDVWYLHNKTTPADVKDELLEAQEIAKKAGKIRFRGVSTHGNAEQIAFLGKHPNVDVILTMYNFAMDPSMTTAMAEARKNGKGVVGMKVMAGGFRRNAAGDQAASILKRDGAMLAALKWVLSNQAVDTTIPGMMDMEQLDENMRAMATPFSPDDAKVLKAQLEYISPMYCRNCGECAGTCQQGLPVADLIRILTYADGYGQFALARERFLELPAEQTSVKCGDCDKCTVECRRGVDVTARLTRAQELFAC